MERLDREQAQSITMAFRAKYGDHPNFNQVCMRFNAYDGNYLQVRVKDIWNEMVEELPQIFNGCNVFVEEAPAVISLPQS